MLIQGLTLLRRGIESGDWGLVCQGYTQITGEPVKSGEASSDQGDRQALERIRDIVAGQLRTGDLQVEFDAPAPAPPSSPGDASKLALNDIELDRKLLAGVTPTPRRAAVQYVDVVCAKCNKKENVHPSLAPRRVDSQDNASSYVCDSCISRGKGCV